MNNLSNQANMKLDIQAIGLELNYVLVQRLLKLVRKLKQNFPKVHWIDVHLKQSGKQLHGPRELNISFGIPGQDMKASEKGSDWKNILKNVEKKLFRPINKSRQLA